MDDLLQHALTILSTTPERWRALATTVQPDLLARTPATGEWSALDCLRHLVATERHVFPVRLAALRAGRDFEAYDPDRDGAMTAPAVASELVRTFEGLRSGSLKDVARLAPDDLARTARHAELGPVTLAQLLNEWVAHDLMHTVQGERALMQPFIVGSGPWRGYFVDHEARASG